MEHNSKEGWDHYVHSSKMKWRFFSNESFAKEAWKRGIPLCADCAPLSAGVSRERLDVAADVRAEQAGARCQGEGKVGGLQRGRRRTTAAAAFTIAQAHIGRPLLLGTARTIA